MRLVKKLVLIVTPALVLFGSIEVLIRTLDLTSPKFTTAPLPTEFSGLAISDSELFWKMKPGVILENPDGTTVSINSDGFRGAEVIEKKENEYRIVCLGESTTFGAGVEQYETYSYLLETELNKISDSVFYSVLSCGFSAYSSFQLLKYLELKAIDFKPDMVILYSEVNDYLPSSFRNFGHDERTFGMSDQQLYESSVDSWMRKLIDNWALAKFLVYRIARQQMQELSESAPENPVGEIGLNEKLPSRIAELSDGEVLQTQFNEKNFGRRVVPSERASNIRKMQSLCDERNIKLVIIHPSYQGSDKHECVLTDVCQKDGLIMFDAYDMLHLEGIPKDSLFLDSWHPTPLGHRSLARGLAGFLVGSDLLN